MNKIKKSLFVLALGLGLSSTMTSIAFAKADGAGCLSLKEQCQSGDINACYLYDVNNCIICESFPGHSTCENNHTRG